jgi:sugar (pentulose or hexulose) kinase
MTFFVLNTGGKALEWFHSVFCQEMDEHRFYHDYVPQVLSTFLDSPDLEAIEASLPQYAPYLQGSRYSLEQLTAGFNGLTLETTREMLLMSIVRGNLLYDAQHLKEVETHIAMGKTATVSGGLAKMPGFLRAKKRWGGDLDYRFQDQSSLRGAAMLGRMYQEGDTS